MDGSCDPDSDTLFWDIYDGTSSAAYCCARSLPDHQARMARLKGLGSVARFDPSFPILCIEDSSAASTVVCPCATFAISCGIRLAIWAAAASACACENDSCRNSNVPSLQTVLAEFWALRWANCVKAAWIVESSTGSRLIVGVAKPRAALERFCASSSIISSLASATVALDKGTSRVLAAVYACAKLDGACG